MSEIDYAFVQLMFMKYSKHLQDVVTSIETLIANYDKQLVSLAKLDPKKYGNYIKELEGKKAEAFIKLANVCPNIEKMAQQADEIQTLMHSDVSIGSREKHPEGSFLNR